MQNLWPVASKVIILWLRNYEDNQVVININYKLLSSKIMNQKRLLWKMVSKRIGYLVLKDPYFNYFYFKMCECAITNTRFKSVRRYSN